MGYLINGDGSARVSFAASGDVDLSGAVNVFDLIGVNTAGAYGQGNYFPAAPTTAGAGGVAAVPEPASWLIVAAGAAGLAIAR